MTGKIEIKKELSETEFQVILIEFQESIKKQKNIDDLNQSFQELVKKITPAKEIHLLIRSEIEHVLETTTLQKNITIDVSSQNSLLRKCYQTKVALFTNDVARDRDYNETLDNFSDYPLKNLLIIPLLTKEGNVLGIIWAAIPKKDWNQYMQSDVKYMMRFSIINEKILKEEMAAFHEKVDAKYQEEIKEEYHSEANQTQSSSITKKIKSWFFTHYQGLK